MVTRGLAVKVCQSVIIIGVFLNVLEAYFLDQTLKGQKNVIPLYRLFQTLFFPESPAIGFLKEAKFGLNVVTYCRQDTMEQQTQLLSRKQSSLCF